MTTTKKIRVNFVRRAIPTRGPFSSDDYNAAQEETSVDFNAIAERWNTEAYTLFNSLPRGTDEKRWVGATAVPDPLADGLDGTTILVDLDSTSGSGDLLWNDTNYRPLTITEMGTYLDGRITDIYNELTESIESTASGLSTEQWDRLGQRINDDDWTSAVGSLDNVATVASSRVSSVIGDIYNDSGDLGLLTNSIQDMVGALLTLHGGTWSSDITLDHAAMTLEEGYIRSYVGKPGTGSLLPAYAYNRYILDNDSLLTAIDKLDNQLYSVTTANNNHIAAVNNPHQVSLEKARTQSSLMTGGVTFTTGNINMNNVGRIINLAAPSNNTDAATKLYVDTQIATYTANRYEFLFSGHTDINEPIQVDHYLGVTFPLVQVIDTTSPGESSGLLIDEDYIYEQEHGITVSDAFINVVYLTPNTFNVYTNIPEGRIIYVG
jgi:hypothetical protein